MIFGKLSKGNPPIFTHNAVFYPGTLTINEFMDRLEPEEPESEESTAADTIEKGTRTAPCSILPSTH